MPRLTLKNDLAQNITDAVKNALIRTGNAVINDIVEADIVPRATGVMEGTLTPLDITELDQGTVRIHSNTPYANRLYHHPEYNFHREPWEGGEGNPNAQAYWFEPWATGDRKKFVEETFTETLKQEVSKI